MSRNLATCFQDYFFSPMVSNVEPRAKRSLPLTSCKVLRHPDLAEFCQARVCTAPGSHHLCIHGKICTSLLEVSYKPQRPSAARSPSHVCNERKNHVIERCCPGAPLRAQGVLSDHPSQRRRPFPYTEQRAPYTGRWTRNGRCARPT